MSGYITALPAATTLTGNELLEVSQVSTTVTITGTTISALASDNSFNDSGSGFVTAGFAAGDRVKVTGFTGNVANNILVGVITALTAGKMTIGGTDGDVIVDDAAGESVTIAKWISKRALASDLGGVSGYTDEQARDAVGAALTDTGLAVVTVNDVANTIDVNVPAAAGSDYRTGTDATKALTSDAVWDAAAHVALTDGATVTPDFAAGINFTWTIGGNRTLANPSNAKAGQTGCIEITQDGTGSRTISFGTDYRFVGGTDIVLSTAASSLDLIFYYVTAGGKIFLSAQKAIAA